MLKRIKLSNFCDIEELEINFRSDINLLIGDNGSGKTTILKACQYVLGTFFNGFKAEFTPSWTSLTPKKSDFREQRSLQGDILEEQPVEITFDLEYNSQDSFSEQVLRKNRADNKTRALTTTFASYKEYSKELLSGYASKEGRHRPLPLFAYYSTEDIHARRQIAPKAFEKQDLKATFGYFNALTEHAFLPYWVKRMLSLEEKRRILGGGIDKPVSSSELSVVTSALMSALGEGGADILEGINILRVHQDIEFVMKDGRIISHELLPDGLRRVISIIMDIAFRCAILNKTMYGEEAARKTQGTVLIDEIDLHLHPRLQSTIMSSLKAAFPKLQFIVSSHAPMIMSCLENTENNQVYKLYYDKDNKKYGVSTMSTYGLDLSTISRMILGLTTREPEVEQEIYDLFGKIENENYSEAKEMIKKLRQRFGNQLPELTEASVILDFMNL